MSQPSVSTPSRRTKEQSNPRIVCIDVDHSEVVIDIVPLSIILVHVTPIRKPRTTSSKKDKPSKVRKSSSPFMSVQMAASDVRKFEPSTAIKKPHSMTSMYLDPINVEPNIDASSKSYVVPKVMENVETSENTNKHRFVTTLSKSGMIVAERDNVDKYIRVMISQVLGIKPKTVVVSDVSTSLAQTDSPIETSLDKSDGKPDSENVPTKSPEKSEEKDDYDSMFGDSYDKEENSGEKNDQSTNVMNLYDLDSDDEPIGKNWLQE